MRVAVFAALGLATAMPATRDEQPKDELRKFKGTWVAESREYEGKVETKAELKGLKLVVDGDKFVITGAGDRVELEGTISVDPTAKPKAVDVKVTVQGKKDSVVVPAIYELDGDTLKTAFPLAGGDRPKDFTTKVGSKVRVTVYHRAKE